jgi:hypothetical protein
MIWEESPVLLSYETDRTECDAADIPIICGCVHCRSKAVAEPLSNKIEEYTFRHRRVVESYEVGR